VLDVAGRGEQDDGSVARDVAQVLHDVARGRVPQLVAIAALEVGEALRFVPIPPAQLVARRDVLRPLVEVGVLLLHAARPEPVDEHPVTTVVAGCVVDAVELDPRMRAAARRCHHHLHGFVVEPSPAW